MPLTQAAIDELKAIYKKHYGEELSDVDAWDMANRLLRLYSVLYGLQSRPIDTKIRTSCRRSHETRTSILRLYNAVKQKTRGFRGLLLKLSTGRDVKLHLNTPGALGGTRTLTLLRAKLLKLVCIPIPPRGRMLLLWAAQGVSQHQVKRCLSFACFQIPFSPLCVLGIEKEFSEQQSYR